MKRVTLAALALLAATADAAEDPCYRIEPLPEPDSRLLLEVGGLNFSPDGTLYIGTRRGELWTLKNGKYTLFATGLAECLGVLPTDPGVVIVPQRGEVTRLIDLDHDGVADRYESITEAFAYAGNYHEFNFGFVRDAAGNLYGTLNLQHTDHDPWGGRFMGADIKDRGTAYKISPDGTFSTFCWGLRSPNGLTTNAAGDIFCAESQGEFTATNCIQHLQEGRFYGHPASLSFKPGFTGSPKTTTIDDLAKMRTPPVAWIPYTRQGKSVNEPRFDLTKGKFGPFDGQLFAGDCSDPIITRVFLEKVAGDYQGACFPFLRDPLLEGSNRIVFSSDGSMIVGLTNRGWASGTYGLRQIKWTGKTPPDIQKMELRKDGFLLTFTTPMSPDSASDPASYELLHYRYEYHPQYGSDELDKTPIKVTKVELSPDHRTAHLILPELLPGKVYELQVKKLTTQDGSRLRNPTAWYTLNRLLP